MMQILSLAWGILAIIGMFVAFFPCLGAFNWLNIPFAAIGLILSFIAFVKAESGKKSMSVAGIVLCGIAVLFGIIRLSIGGGIL